MIETSLQNAHGKIPYGMTNDYMFRQDYNEANAVIHIGFLDYTLFRNWPEFYASYKLINVKNYQKYSDNITLNVVDLTRIDLATEEDKVYHIDGWAKLLKATTWEEVNMLAAKDENMREAAKSIFVYNTESAEIILKCCRVLQSVMFEVRIPNLTNLLHN